MPRALSGLRRFATSEFLRHGFIVFVSTTLVNALGYAFHFAISRKIGVVQYGVLSALNAVFMLSLVVSTIAATVLVKYAAEFRATGDRARLAALVRALLRYGTAAAIVATAAAVASSSAIAHFLKIDDVAAVALAMVVIGISVLTPSLRAVFQGIEDFRMFALTCTLESALKAVFGIGFVYAGYGVEGAFGGWALGSAIAVVATAALLVVRFRHVPGAAVFIDFRRLLSTMAGVSIATALLTSLSYADVLVVKHYADPTTAGLYGALSLAGKILLFLGAFLPAVVLPKATRLALAGQSPLGVLVQACGLVTVISVAGLAVYGFFPRFVVTALAGPSFAPAAPYVFSYACAMALLAALQVVVMYKIGIHRFDFLVPLALCAAGQIVGISLHHATLEAVIEVLLLSNGVALLVSAFRINAPLGSPVAVQRSDAAA